MKDCSTYLIYEFLHNCLATNSLVKQSLSCCFLSLLLQIYRLQQQVQSLGTTPLRLESTNINRQEDLPVTHRVDFPICSPIFVADFKILYQLQGHKN